MSKEARAATQPSGPNAKLVFYFMCFSGAMVNELLFVLSDPPIQFVYQAIDRGIHVFFGIISVNRATIYVHRGFRLMPEFFDCQDTAYVRHQIKMPLDLFNFGLDITSQGFGYFDVMA
jgi:hypothetical protein